MFQVKRFFGIWYHESLCLKVAQRYNIRRIINKVRNTFKAFVTFSRTRKHLARAYSTVLTKRVQNVYNCTFSAWRNQVQEVRLSRRLLKSQIFKALTKSALDARASFKKKRIRLQTKILFRILSAWRKLAEQTDSKNFRTLSKCFTQLKMTYLQ